MKKLLFIPLVFLARTALGVSQPPYEIKDAATAENMRVIYFTVDQHRHTGEDGSNRILMQVSAFNSTLGSGTTFFAFVPDESIVITKLTSTIIVPGIGGTGDSWICGSTTSAITLITAADLGAGVIVTTTSIATIPAKQSVYCRMESTASVTPTASIVLQYRMQ